MEEGGGRAARHVDVVTAFGVCHNDGKSALLDSAILGTHELVTLQHRNLPTIHRTRP